MMCITTAGIKNSFCIIKINCYQAKNVIIGEKSPYIYTMLPKKTLHIRENIFDCVGDVTLLNSKSQKSMVANFLALLWLDLFMYSCCFCFVSFCFGNSKIFFILNRNMNGPKVTIKRSASGSGTLQRSTHGSYYNKLTTKSVGWLKFCQKMPLTMLKNYCLIHKTSMFINDYLIGWCNPPDGALWVQGLDEIERMKYVC